MVGRVVRQTDDQRDKGNINQSKNTFMRKSESLLLLSCVLAGIQFVACTSEIENPVHGEPCTIVAQIEDVVATRTCVDESPDAAGADILWQPEEEIGVYSNSTKNAKFTSTNEEVVGKTEFEGVITENPTFAYYPYSKSNDGIASDAVAGELPLVQHYSAVNKKLQYDWKIGTPMSSDPYKFSFRHLFALIRFTIDAKGTDLATDNLMSISLTFPNDVTMDAGTFKMDLSTGKVTFDRTTSEKELSMVWDDMPVLTDMTYNGYITCAPVNVAGKDVTVTINTTRHKVTFTATLKVNIEANKAYTIPLVLKSWREKLGEQGFKVETLPDAEVPKITSLQFNADSNVPTDGSEACALLRRQVYDKGSRYHSKFETATAYRDDQSSYYNHTATLEGNEFSLYIPYLNDRNLVPTFKYTSGATIMVDEGDGFKEYVEKTTVDFSKNPTIRVVKGRGFQDYSVNLTNTGLPVVVISQPTSGFATTSWSQTGLTVVNKSEDFPENATISFYEADGTKIATVKDSGVRLRGNSTMTLPKKPFAIKLGKKTGFYGMAKHKRWVLLANWKDHSLMRNKVAYDIANIVADAYPTGSEKDGIGWQPTGVFVELVYNNVHVGNYYLCEQIKIDENRVNIGGVNGAYDKKDFGAISESQTSEFGYLLEFDDAYDEYDGYTEGPNQFTTRHYLPVMFKDDVDDAGYIKKHVRDKILRIEENLYKGNYTEAYKDLDLYSVVDYWLIQELTMNGEIKHPKSVYMYIDGNGKLTAGPTWDFDWQSFPITKNITKNYYGYTYDYDYGTSLIADADHKRMKNNQIPTRPNSENDKPYMWYPMLVTDSEFQRVAQERWNVIKGLVTAYTSQIPSIGQSIAKSWEENQKMWPNNETIIKSKWQGPHVFCGDEAYTFEQSYNALPEVIEERMAGMNLSNSRWYPSKSITENSGDGTLP